MTKNNLTYAITLIVACTAILAPHAVAHLTIGDILRLPFLGIGVPNLSKCLGVVSEVPGCLEELVSSVLSIQPRLLGPTCCSALLQVDQNCWPRLLTMDPASPSHLQEYCVELQERAPPMPHPPPPPPLAQGPPPPPPLARPPPPLPLVPIRAQAPPPLSLLPQAPPPLSLLPIRAQAPPPISVPPIKAQAPPPLSLPPIKAQAPPPLSLPPIKAQASPPLSLPPIKAQAPPPISLLPIRALAPLPPPPSPLLQVPPPPSSLPRLPGCPTMSVPTPMSNPDDYDEY